MATYKLVTIDQRFTAETIARTGSEQLLEKAMRSFVGLYNEEDIMQRFKAAYYV